MVTGADAPMLPQDSAPRGGSKTGHHSGWTYEHPHPFGVARPPRRSLAGQFGFREFGVCQFPWTPD